MPPRRSARGKAIAEPEPTSQLQDLPVRAKDDSPLASLPPKSSVQGTLKVFDDDDDDDDVAVTTTLSAVEKPTVIADSEEESESDDDDAPEEAATAHVVSKSEKASKIAQQVAQQQAAEQKRKRQQRDALFKQQASERKANKTSQEATTAPLPEDFFNSLSDDEDEDDADAMDVDDEETEARPRPRKISTIEQKLTRMGRAPKDERFGSTLYRVEKKRDERLAPKAKKQSHNRKGLLLARGRAPVKSTGGFFKK